MERIAENSFSEGPYASRSFMEETLSVRASNCSYFLKENLNLFAHKQISPRGKHPV
jgi:hypothetical protein